MPNGLTPQVVDVPLLLPNQTPPKHAGPLGRLTSMVNAQIKHFLPSSQQQPQKVEVIPRDGFTALTAQCRASSLQGGGTILPGTIVTGDWNNPELLAPLGNQLVSICDSIPRVNSGASWAYYGDRRALTQQLSEDVLHTTNRILGAPDSAYLSGVTCFAWTEILPNGNQQGMIGFRGDDGAWVTAPRIVLSPVAANILCRVVTDGTYFWFVGNNTFGHLVVIVFDTHGVQIQADTTSVPLRWTPTPGYWDIATFNDGAPYVGIVQPHAFSAVGANVGIETYHLTISGTTITVTSVTNVVVLCNGPIAYGDSTQGGFSGFPYIVTASSSNNLNGYAMNHVGVILNGYSFGTVLAGIPDSLTGWMEAGSPGPTAHAAYSILSNFSPTTGPANDPGLRYTRSYACTSLGAASLTNQVNGVLLSSRAFRVDNDWYAATYYQSGGGTAASTTPQVVTPSGTLDYFTGASQQPVTVQSSDFATGAANVSVGSGYIAPTQAVGSIAHSAGDAVVASSGTWTFLVGPFVGTGTAPFDGTSTIPSAAGAILHIAGAANAQNNGDWWVTGVTSNTTVSTEPISLQGNPMVNETFGVGVTASLIQVWPVILPMNPAFGLSNTPYPDGFTAQKFYGGTATIAGASGAVAAINGTYSIFRMYFGQDWRGYKPPFFANDPQSNLILMTKVSGSAGTAGTLYVVGPGFGAGAGTITISPALANAWALTGLQGDHDTRAGINVSLTVTGAHQGGNNGAFPETANPMPGSPYGVFVDVTGSQPTQRAEVFASVLGLPTIARVLTDPAQVMLLHINAITFDSSYLNATVVMTGMLRSENNNTSYQITQLATWIDTHTVVLSPIDGHSGQTLYNFTGVETVTITKDASAGTPAYQPCWYMMPLSLAQSVAGRWDWAIAYADWRHDGAAVAGGTFEKNGFPCALSSVTSGPTGRQFALPFRAQSFTAGQLVTNAQGGIIGVQSTAESTIGLKLFTLATATGQAIVNSGEMLLPGPQASEFSASGFTEDGINLGPEQPYIVGQNTAAIALGLTKGATYQIVVVWEVTSENGDRTWSVTSPPLSYTLTGTNNTATYGGRMPGPTLRVVGVSIYRTANTGNPPTATIQHYKITNDLAVNGPGFTFTAVNGGSASDTWQFVDQVPDKLILDAEVLYTDKGFLQRFPAPANRGGVGSWQNRTWVIGYDGAIWMSGEKDEGDSIWFHPAFRYVLPTDDEPVALASMENYLLVFCSRSIFYIPAVQFPDATGANGTLPTPQPLPFTHGCTGFAVTVEAGVAYSSTAGGVWLINRALNNSFLSQPMQDSLTTGITGMVVDGEQRLVVATGSTDLFVFDQISQAWLHWTVINPALLVTTWQGNATYQDAARVRGQVAGTYADITDGASVGVAPAITMTLVMGPVKALKHTWAFNLTGQFLGPCLFFAQLSQPDDPTAVATYAETVAAPGVLNVEINPMVEEATTYDLLVSAAFPGVPVPAGSYSLELITAEAGIEPTLAKRPNAQRPQGG